MDDCHQFFAIAKAGQYYRLLAGVRHMCLWGMATLRQCLHVLHIFSHCENRLALQQELRFAEDYFRNSDPPSVSSAPTWYSYFGPCPFPFITTCLMMGAALNPETLHAGVVNEEPYRFPFHVPGSRHGITIIDITDLDNVKYCFVHSAATMPIPVPVPGRPCSRFQPLTGWQYAMNYYRQDDMNLQSAINLPNALEEKSLVDIEALVGELSIPPFPLATSSSSPLTHMTLVSDTWPYTTWSDYRPILPAASPPIPRQVPKSLLEISLVKVVDVILSSNDLSDFKAVKDTLEVLPNIRLLLREYLLRRAKDVGRTKPSLLLLAFAYEGENTLDWAPFINLKLSHITVILENGSFSSAETINLSGLLTSTCIERLSPLLSHLPALKTLCVLEKPDRVDDTLSVHSIVQLTSLNPGLRLNKILNSGLFSMPFRGISWIPDTSQEPTVIPGFPSVQLLVYHRSEDIRERVAPYEHFSLGDALLNPGRLVNIILRYCQILIADRYQMGGGTGYQLAVCIATASSTPGSPETGEIGVLPAQTYLYGKGSNYSLTARGCYSDMRDLRPGQWTILMVRHLPGMGYGDPGTSFDRGFMYAFLRCRSVIPARRPQRELIEIDEADLDVFSFEGFLQETCPHTSPVDLERFLQPLREIAGRNPFFHPRPHINDVLQCMSAREASSMLVKFMENIPNVDREKQQTLDERI
ncbi:unnamed protein product [Clonostachys byssicola]|uniref:Uncharacterized protein n=1 Tax=Clonostachys byssicola TaxID=160290 RepID=A0A9N9U2S1_9HYPO|nr:unnamed protein product [Clonostachys byssicola]